MARAATIVDPAPTSAGPLQDRIGYQFASIDLLTLALTHRSWCAEHEGFDSNERLEFLGDAVLGIVVTDHIFTRYPTLSEGEMAKVRAAVVSAAALSEVAAELEVGVGLRLGRGEQATGGRTKPSILADAMEAILGAVYIDGGDGPARRVILDLFGARIAEAASEPGIKDYKTRLQELAARRCEAPPEYLVVEDGPDHEKSFHASVVMAGEVLGGGMGRSKKQAQQAAAHAAWLTLVERAAHEAAEPGESAGEPSEPAADVDADTDTDTSEGDGADGGELLRT